MDSIVYYNHKLKSIIDLGKIEKNCPGGYLTRCTDAGTMLRTDVQGPEHMIFDKIRDNKEGYFDFSKNMIDIGAYMGIYRWVLPFQKAWLFEGSRESYMYCCANAVLHGRVKDTFIYNTVLSNNHEPVVFNGFEVVEDNRGARFNRWGIDYSTCGFREDRSMILDDFCELFDNVGFIKVDCEGMDWKILDGAENTIINAGYPPILFENWDDNNPYIGWVGESEEQRKERNLRIRWVLKVKYGYHILWNWGDHETHLAIKD